MKREVILTFFLSVSLSFALSVSAVGCMVTGFDLTMEHMAAVTQLCFWVSLISSFLLLWKWGGAVTLGLLVLTCSILWFRGIPSDPFLSLITGISRRYHSAYNWGYLFLATPGQPADWPMAALGGIIALSAGRTLTRGKDTFVTLFLSALPLASCLVVTDTVPDTRHLFVLMTGMILLLLTGSVREANPHQGSRLTAIAAIPVVLAVTLLFQFVPQHSYVNRSKEFQAKIFSYAQKLPQLVETTVAEVATNIQGGDTPAVDLKSLGARPRYTNVVMEVTTDTGGILYLRGQDYDAYDGTGWTASPYRAENFLCDGNLAGNVTIRTRGKKDILYLPYYPQEGVSLTGGLLRNEQGEKEYTFTRIVPQDVSFRDPHSVGQDAQIQYAPAPEASAFGSTAEGMRYLTLPNQTKAEAMQILQTFLPENASRQEQAEAIARFVRSSAEYDLNTGPMDADAEDFALWFLQESETGYCVHFATAAVVLLRAADIPARYVTGYMVDTQAGQVTRVTAGNAHAWAEYFVPQLGTWVVLEATPAEEIPLLPTATSEEAEPESTEAESTAPSTPADTEPTAGSQETFPTEPEGEKSPSFRGGWLVALGILMLIPLQRSLRLTLRRNRLRSGGPNDQALARWQEVQLLAKLLKEEAPEALLELAQKAKFSQHTLTGEELLQFDAYLNSCRRQLKQHPWYAQLLYRYLWVAY